MKDLYNKLEAVSVLDPISVTATATYTDIDLQGFNSCILLISCGIDASIDASNKITYVLWDSADGDTYAVVETADMLDLTVTSGVVLTIDNVTTLDNSISKIGYVGGKRYLQLVGTVTATVDPPISIVLIKGDPENAPVD